MEEPDLHNYTYNDHHEEPDPPHQPMYLDLVVRRLSAVQPLDAVLDAGCGDGNFLESLAQRVSFEAFGLDASASGIEAASRRIPGRFAQGSLYDSLTKPFGREHFDAIIAIEVIEHLYDPRAFVRQAERALRPGGVLILTTPYWGYFKNVLLALTNRIDRSLTALWDGGHIKHWSRRTLTTLVTERNFEVVGFDGSSGRRPPLLWNGMMMTFERR